MKLNNVYIDDTFAEAFSMKATRIIITAMNLKWAYRAANAIRGFASSVIACGCEADIERELKRVIIHGCLHLLGYDDQTSEEKKTMTYLEDHYLNQSVVTNQI